MFVYAVISWRLGRLLSAFPLRQLGWEDTGETTIDWYSSFTLGKVTHTHTHTLSQRACVHMLMSWTPGLGRDRGPQWHWCNNDCSLLTWTLWWRCRVGLCCTAKQIPTIFNWYKVELLKLYCGNLFIIVCINSVIVQGVDLFLDQKSLIITANYAISKTNLNNSL